jgi:hypothetical protein
MMVCQVLGSAPGVPVLSFAHNSEPLQLNPGAATMMPRQIKNSLSVNGTSLIPFPLHWLPALFHLI